MRSRELRRVQVGYTAFSFSEHASWLAILVYALERGGPREVGVVAVAQLVPAVLITPFAAYGGDRFPPQRAIAVGYLLQSVAMAVTAAGMAAGAPAVAYVAGAAAATATTFTRPVMGSLLPTITHAPTDLVAANVIIGFIGQVGVFGGPLIAGLLMALLSPAAVFAAAAVATLVACWSALGLEPTVAFVRDPALDAGTVVSRVFAGFATLARQARIRVLVALGAVAAFVRGIGDVVFVTFTDARLDGGGGQAGVIAAAYGMGAVGGALGAARLVHTSRVGRQFLLSGGLMCVPLLALSVVGEVGAALVAFAVLGMGESLVQLTASVTIQRVAPTVVMARIFGILEGLAMGALALGSLSVTALTAATSLGTAFVVLAAVVASAIGIGVFRLRHHGDEVPVPDDRVVRRILRDPVFASLPAPTVERLARSSLVVQVGPGDVVVAEGDVGDRYYLVDDGELAVTIGGRHVRDLGAGASFGEIALLRDVPRTATVRATSPTRLLAVDRDDFLEIVTGHPRSLGRATEVVDRFLGG